MIQSILVPAAGSAIDEVVFEAAFAAAQPFAAHLEFFHIRVDSVRAARYTPHVAFARGPAIKQALDALEAEAETRSADARLHFEAFCTRRGIEITEEPQARDAVSAHWHEAGGEGPAQLLTRSRHSDLTVFGRRGRTDGLPRDLVEWILLGCGRPILLAADRPPQNLTETVMICWKETPEAARAVALAMPWLEQAKQVVVVNVEERNMPGASAVEDLARQLRWHGIRADARCIPATGRPAFELLLVSARGCNAGLVVMGGFGRKSAREMIFGGCTQFFLQEASTCLLVAH